MRALTIRSTFAAIAIAAAASGALGGFGTATAAPSGPCEDVPYVGVCEQFPRGSVQSPPQQSMGEVVLPNGNNISPVG